ncbi:MAG: hypothetical protein AB1791_08630 [Chloroflexota bacterium]
MLARLKQAGVEIPQPLELFALRLLREPDAPIPLHAINELSEGAKKRIYRGLLPPSLLTRFQIDPISWRGPEGEGYVALTAEESTQVVKVMAHHTPEARDPFFYLELADNAFNGIDVSLLVLNDPDSPRFYTDVDLSGHRTLFGTVHRNLVEEERAMRFGLAPGQVRQGLRASPLVLQQLEFFMALLGHDSYYAEPLTYLSAWLFEKGGLGYVSGLRLMRAIDEEFQPGGRLYQALDHSTPFRRPEQGSTVRGRAWAIHDGILAAIGRSWNDVRMVKRIGYQAGVETFPGAGY